MKLAAICCTYKRPAELNEAVQCFLNQTYPKHLREMIILDDAGVHRNQEGDGWRVVSVNTRFRTMGEKRNASAALVSPDVDAYCVWDDDDIYLPWHMEAAAETLKHEHAELVIPSALVYRSDSEYRVVSNSKHKFHGCWSFTRDAFQRVNGYPFIQSGQDRGLYERFMAAGYQVHDSRAVVPDPSYIYRWFDTHKQHLSAYAPEHGYAAMGRTEVPGRDLEVKPALTVDWVASFKRLKDGKTADQLTTGS